MSSTITYNQTKQLTDEQLKRIEENRQKALQLKRQLNNIQNLQSTSSSTNSTNASKTAAPGSTTTSSATSQSKNSSGMILGKCVYFEEEPESRFEIHVGYSKNLIDLFKTIKSRKYNPDTKRWNFSLENYDELLTKIKHQLAGEVKVEPLDRVDKANSKQAKCFLIDRNRFEIEVAYDAELLEVFKTMSTKSYDHNTKKWSFQLKEYDELVKKISTKFNRGTIQIVPLPKIVREMFKDQLEGKNKPRLDPSIDLEVLKKKLDENITKSLMPFQVESICFAVQQEGRLLLADDMGLGKTVQGLAIANYYKDEWPLFIVAPSSVKFMWKESAIRWLSNTLKEVSKDEQIDNYIQVIENGRQNIDKKSKIVIASYDLLAKNVDEICKTNFNVIICDECHLLKSSKAARTKAALRLIQSCKRVVLLSGTPALSRPAELFSQLAAINPNAFPAFHDFGLRYCNGKESRFGWDYSGYSNMQELRILLEEKMLMRREKKDVITQLPSKMREMIILNPALIETKTKSLRQASQKMEDLKGMEKRGALLNYYQETSKVKSKAVCEYVADLLETDKKFLVFGHHQFMLDAIEEECKQKNYEYIRIDGTTGSEKRKHLVDRFQNDEKCLCAILSITAASTGITLTQASLVVFAELFWNPGILVQAEDRVYRIGQRNAVIIQYLCAKGTSDDEMWPLVQSKLNILSKAGLTKENLSEAATINNKIKENPFNELIEESEGSNDSPNDITKDSNNTFKAKSKSPTEKPKLKSDGNLKQATIDQLLNFDISKLEESPPPKKSKL